MWSCGILLEDATEVDLLVIQHLSSSHCEKPVSVFPNLNNSMILSFYHFSIRDVSLSALKMLSCEVRMNMPKKPLKNLELNSRASCLHLGQAADIIRLGQKWSLSHSVDFKISNKTQSTCESNSVSGSSGHRRAGSLLFKSPAQNPFPAGCLGL